MTTHTHPAPKKDTMGMVFVVLSAIVVVLTIYLAFFKKDAVTLETMKVGGAENMALVQQLYTSDAYKTQQTQAIQQVLSSINNPGKANENAPTEEAKAPAGTIDKAKIDAIKQSWYIKGNKKARITILEYSEFLCPFCKRQNDGKVIEQVLEKYPNDVNRMFRNFIVHGDAAKIVAEGAECAGDLWGDAKYYDYVAQAFDLADKSEAGIIGFAKGLALNEGKFSDCLKNKKFSAKVDVETEEGRTLFNVQGTPGNVIIDNEKWTYTLIAGAYPVEEFIKVIDGILAKK